MSIPIQPLKPPFPWFGGKRRVASVIWERLGDVPAYIEPFFGGGAVLLGRPHKLKLEVINDIDGFVANFWRAVKHDWEAVAKWSDWPVNAIDLHARHHWLAKRRSILTRQLRADPDYFDPKIAGWWVWEWKTAGGLSNFSGKSNFNSKRERIWFSPHCIKP